MPCVVVDTNVILVANGQHDEVSADCVERCAAILAQLQLDGRVAIDHADEILDEYLNKTRPWANSGIGDAFVKWIAQNRFASDRIHRVNIRAHPDRGFETFPNDTGLAKFDPSDRKFVAVCRAHVERPPILQATDSKWLDFAELLGRHGVIVDFVCPVDVEKFHSSSQ